MSDLDGTLGLEEDDARLVLTEDGETLEELLIFNSLEPDLNEDTIEHVVSGSENGGHALKIGFEDLSGGGDRDFQDLSIVVQVLDPNTLA